MAPCVRLHTTNKIKLEASGPVNKCYKACYEVHTDMAGGDSVAIYTWSSTCLMLHTWSSDSSDKSRGIYLRAAFMTAFVVYPEAIIQGRLL